MEENKSEEEKIRKCIGCGKQLVGEKLPFCLRCRLSGRNKTADVGKIILGGAMLLGGAKALAEKKSND